jgi:outer membrane protein assembly factor BamA
VFFCAFNKIINAQAFINLQIINTDSVAVFKKINYKKQFTHTQFAEKEITTISLSLINEGYIATSVDSIIKKENNLIAYLNIGEKYQWATLKINEKDQPVIGKIGYGERYFTNRTFRYSELSRMMEKIIVYYENNGYPFANVKLDSVTINKNQFIANIKIEKNVFVKLDSLIVEGNGKVSQKFLKRYLNIKNGMPYNAFVYKGISNKIRQLSFITEKKPPVLKLTDKQNKLHLFLDKKNASQFDGIVGFLPDNKGKTVITGDLKIKLVNNILKSGETFDLQWRRLQSQTQDLKVNIIYPYLFGLPVGVDYAIKLYKKDTTFIDVNNSLGLNYYYSGLNFIKVFYKQRNANLISTNGLQFATSLPDYADVITRAYGLGFFYEKLDYRFNPKTGVSIHIQGSVGDRTIKKNPKINDVAYSNVDLKTNQYQTEGVISGYINLYKNHVLKLATQFGSVFGNNLYKNELMRIGGLRTLRGFDEESIYTSTYIIPTLEYRFLFEKNSNIFLFGEGAWYENNSISTYINDAPISVGAGINFETKAGIFNLSYALGKQFSNGFDLRTGKIHAGLTAVF